MPRFPPRPAPATRPILPLLLALALAACASDGGDLRPAPGDPAPAAAPDAPPAPADLSTPRPTGRRVIAGWMDLREGGKSRLTSLTLVGASTEEGRLIATGRGRMEGGKVVDDRTAADLEAAFERAGFWKYALRTRPADGPPAALGAVWIDRGEGVESLFLLPGARNDPRTREVPDVYDALKKLILYVHQSTPGSMVLSGEGWSGDSMMNQQPGDRGR